MLGLGLPLPEVESFVHGTTLGLNAILTRKGARTGIITNEGFRDILEIARGVVPFAEMRALTEEQQVAFKTVERVFSSGVAGYLTLFVAISVLGSANPNLLSSTRAFYAMAQDGLVPHALTRVSPRWGTPVVSIWSQAVCAFAIVVTLQGFHDVTDFVVFAGFLFYGLTVAAVYLLRRRLPDRERPYRCIGYPWTPALFIMVAIAFVAAMLRDEEKRINALYGLEIIAVGAVYYLLFLRGRAQPATTG